MTFAAVGSFVQTTTTSLSLNPQGTGHLILVTVINKDNNAIWCTGISGGNASWAQLTTVFQGVTHPDSAVIFAGKATATGAATATLSFNGSPTPRCAGQEFSSTLGGWALVAQGGIDSAGTNTWASLTPAASGELYFGYCRDSSSAVAGSTSGYTYDIDSVGNGLGFNPACTAAAQAPAWGDSNQIFGLMALLKEVTPPSSGLLMASFP